jgi:hypothetical protein
MIGFAALVLGGVVFAATMASGPKIKLDDFAQCISDSGGVMYGTWWCSNCQNQKDDFGSAFKYINFVECSSPGGKDFDLCTDKNITAVPVWETAEGYRAIGRQSLTTLSEMFSCSLPEGYVE